MDAILMAGGYGTRIKELTKIYKCKTLIPLLGKPCIEWVIAELNKLNLRRIYLSIDREELLAPYERILKENSVKNIQIHRQYGKHQSGEVILDLKNELDDQFILTYGNNPVSYKFYLSMMEKCKNKGIAISLYSMQTSTTKRITQLDNGNIKNLIYYESSEDYKLKENELFFDKPFFLNKKFIDYLIGEDLRSTPALRNWLNQGNELYGFRTNFPPEFHYEWELPGIESYIKNELVFKKFSD